MARKKRFTDFKSFLDVFLDVLLYVLMFLNLTRRGGHGIMVNLRKWTEEEERKCKITVTEINYFTAVFQD